MKLALCIAATLLFTACQKDQSVVVGENRSQTVHSDVLLPLPCHSTSFVSDYPVVPGQVPPFRFTKGLYPDGRVKTMTMLSRVYPIHPVYKKQAVELMGTFTYATNTAFFKGTREVWEYYMADGGSARRSISKKDLSYQFDFTPQGYCRKISSPDYTNPEVLFVNYDSDPRQISFINVTENADLNAGPALFYPQFDQYGNVSRYDQVYNRWGSVLSYTYDYSIPRGPTNYSFIPSQNWISQEFSLLEVMQWVPQAKHQRKGVLVKFFPYITTTYPFNTGQEVTQGQVYKHYGFDAKGNHVYLTYADNIPQRTTWVCK